MAKKEEEIIEDAPVEEVEEVKHKKEEDAPHKAFREIMEAYSKQNPVKFAAKKEEFERKLAGKLAFGLAPDGSLYDGRLGEHGKRIRTEVVVVK